MSDGSPSSIFFGMLNIRHTILDYLPISAPTFAAFLDFGHENYFKRRAWKFSKQEALKIEQKRVAFDADLEFDSDNCLKFCAAFKAILGQEAFQKLLQSEWNDNFEIILGTEVLTVSVAKEGQNCLVEFSSPRNLSDLFDIETQNFMKQFGINTKNVDQLAFLWWADSMIRVSCQQEDVCELNFDRDCNLHLRKCEIFILDCFHTKNLLPSIEAAHLMCRQDAEVIGWHWGKKSNLMSQFKCMLSLVSKHMNI